MKTIAILPAYNAARTVRPLVASIPKGVFDEILLVDDSSADDTYGIAKRIAGIQVYRTPHNLGYGGNLKYCLSLALARGADTIVELHPDGEYKTDGIRAALGKIQSRTGLVLGNRFSGDPVASGMHRTKYIVTRMLSSIDNVILGTHIPDMHQGFRVYTKKLLSHIPFKTNSDDFSFSFEIIAQAVFFAYPIASVPVSVSYTGTKRGATTRASFLYTLATFRILCEYLLARLGVPTKHFVG